MLIAASSIMTATPDADGQAQVLAPGYVACEAGAVIEVGPGDPPGRPDIELGSGHLVPGFVDLQVNGYFGVELGDAEPDDWAEVARRLPRR